jgi:hypothetical protein
LFDLHFADSELLAPRWDGDTLVLAFAAALVRPRAAPAAEHAALGPGLGHVRGLSLRLAHARVTGDTTNAFGRLADGHWQHEGQPLRRTMAVPQAVDQPMQLSLALGNGTALHIRAAALQALFSGVPDYRESLAC